MKPAPNKTIASLWAPHVGWIEVDEDHRPDKNVKMIFCYSANDFRTGFQVEYESGRVMHVVTSDYIVQYEHDEEVAA